MCSFLPPETGRDEDDHDRPRIGVGIGTSVVDVDMLMHAGFFDGEDEELTHQLHHALHLPMMNALASSPPAVRALLRRKTQEFLRDSHAGQQMRRLRQKAVHEQKDVRYFLPVLIQNYTDFYASVHHAKNVGSMFRPDNPLLPNYKHVPIGYHGRASSIITSGREIRRPVGQTNIENAATPSFGPSKRLDYELEFGCVIGSGNPLGDSVSATDAPKHIFGFCLVNDWSARDIQAWEYQPLGPFLAKNFATTISPWIVPLEAMTPFRVPGPARESGDPRAAALPPCRRRAGRGRLGARRPCRGPHPVRRDARQGNRAAPSLQGQCPRHVLDLPPDDRPPHQQRVQPPAPATSSPAATVSGPTADSRGCMLELTWVGNGPDGKPLPRKPVELPGGEKRTFLEDGDTLTLRGWCEREGYRRIGFGECSGTIVPARA